LGNLEKLVFVMVGFLLHIHTVTNTTNVLVRLTHNTAVFSHIILHIYVLLYAVAVAYYSEAPICST